jgi:drug/metabolite transporter (DMT)-like permease
MPEKSKSFRTISIFFMLINTLCWGAALPIVKPALEFITPYQFLLYRFIFASIFSFPLFFYYLPKIKHIWKTLFKIIALELIGTTLALSFLYEGLSRTSSIQASLIATTTPIFIILGGMVFLKEKEEKHEWIGLGLAVLGTLLLTIEPLIYGKSNVGSFSLWGNSLVLFQNIATAIYFLLAKRFYKGVPKLFVTTVSFYVGMMTFLFLDQLSFHGAATNMAQPMFIHLSYPAVLFAVLYMATFGSIIGLTAYIKGQDGIEASEASVFTYLQPLVFIPLSVLWLNEKLNFILICAVILIGLGVWVSEYRVKKSTSA